jgi:hypothetical protein
MDWQEVEQQIRDIPGNGPVLEKLCELLESGEAIALVGAGASAGLWPLWDKFLEGMIGYALDQVKINQDEADFLKSEATTTPLETAQDLRNRLGEEHYFKYLQDTFKDQKSSQTGGAYTPTHQALLQLPIQNYLTLNYDAGLTNARAALYPEATSTYFFWDQEEAHQILNNTEYKKLILHAHGRYDYTNSIILTIDDYRRAYDTGMFYRTLNSLFADKSLVFVGFGLSDPYIKQLFNNVKKDFTKALNHIAFVGLDKEEMKTIGIRRSRVEKVFGSQIIFYPSENNHQALTLWLEVLAKEKEKSPGAEQAKKAEPIKTPASLKERLADNYVHNPTDDENYQGRVEEIAALNRWGKDPGTRIIGITGIGGQGKTSLVGHWLKCARDRELENMPVFYWSFYEDLDIPKFLKELSEYLLQVVRPTVKMEPLQSVLVAVRKVRILLVLDGLEVIQEEDDNRHHHGYFKDPLLLQFLKDWGRYPHQSLMILTSRFSYPELSRFSGVSFHQLSLVKLSNEDGAALLEKLGLWTKEKKTLYEYVEKLHGHPLLLRVLAATVNRGHAGSLDEFDGSLFLDALPDERLEEKFKNMFEFYEKQLHEGQKELLGIISLFKRPVEIKSFLPLVKNMKSLKGTGLEGMEENEIQKQVDALIKDFLVEKTREGITCHPVIRDYFRETLQIGGVKKEVADFLSKRPARERPKTIGEVRDLVDAVVLLCEAGELKAADDLVTSRLSEGGYGFSAFKVLPAPLEGLECHLALVGDESRRQKLDKEVGRAAVAVHMSWVSIFNALLGNLPQAREWRYKEREIWRLDQRIMNQAGSLFTISEFETDLGNIREALKLISQAQDLSTEVRSLDDLGTEWGDKSFYQYLLGETDLAYQGFEIALAYRKKVRPYEKFLYSVWGNQQTEFLIRLKAWDQFQQVNDWNIETSIKYNWNNVLAICHFLQGWAEVQQRNLEKAEASLCEADKILRIARMPQHLCRLDWAWGLLAEAQGDYQKGMDKVNESLSVSADKGFRLWQADGLTLRGRLRIMQFKQEGKKDTEVLERAGDDGREALTIADDTGYIWAKIEALELLASYHQTKATLPGTDTEDETEQAQRYAREAASLQEGLYLTEEQMEQLKAQARKEFETQIADWDRAGPGRVAPGGVR